MKKLLLLTAFLFFNYFLCQAQWKQTNGPNGALIKSIVTIGTNTFVGTLFGGVFLSADTGNTWATVNSGFSLSGMYVLDTIGSSLIAGTNDGVFISSNNGASWTIANTGLPSGYAAAFAQQGTTIYAGTASGVFVSTNGGASWAASSLDSLGINTLAVINTSVFAGTNQGVFVSTDNGASWTTVNSGLTNTYIITLKRVGTKLYAGTLDGVFISSDMATTWTSAGLAGAFINCFAFDGTYVFAATNTTVYATLNDGATWTEKKAGLPAMSGGVVSLAASNGHLFAGLGNGLGMFISNDDGASWKDIDASLFGQYIFTVAMKGTTIFAGAVGYHGLFISGDNGNTWSSTFNDTSSNQLNNMNVLHLAISDSTIFAGTNGAGIFISTDNGVNWHPSNSGLTDQYIYSITVHKNVIYAGGDDGEIFRSVNNGVSWNLINPGMSTYPIRSMAVNGSMIYAATDGGGVFLSNDNGGSWTAANTGLSDLSTPAIAVHGDTILAGTSSSGVFISINNGASWTAFNAGLTSKFITAFVNYGNTVFVCTIPSGVYVLDTDKWLPANSGITNLNVSSIAISNNNVVVGTAGNSVWTNTLNGNVISGVVKINAGAINAGYTKLYYYRKGAHMSLSDSVQVDPSGAYTFSNVLPGNYVVYANATSAYPLTAPTYCDSTALWDSASILTATLDTTIIKNIQLVEFSPSTGNGKITGGIIKGAGFYKHTIGDPIPGIDISVGKRPKPSQTIISHTTTDSNGNYVFDKLPTGDYEVLVDIPGLSKDSYKFSITATDTLFTNLNYIADSSRIRIDSVATGIRSFTINDAIVKIYPNPFSKQTLIDLELNDNGPVEIILYNSIGQRVSTIENTNLSKGHYKFDLTISAKGVYLVSFNIKGQYSSYRIVEIE